MLVVGEMRDVFGADASLTVAQAGESFEAVQRIPVLPEAFKEKIPRNSGPSVYQVSKQLSAANAHCPANCQQH